MSGPLVELAVAAGARREARGALAALAGGRGPHAERVLASQRRDQPRADRLVGRLPVAPDAVRREGGERARERLGPIGPSPYARGCLGGAAAKALRSKPAQKVPWAPQSTATRASRSRSKARNAARSAAAVGGSTAFRRAGRSRMIVVTGPFVSLRTPGRSITCILLARHGTHGCPCAVRDVGR